MFFFIKMFLLLAADPNEAVTKELVYSRPPPQLVCSSFSGCTLKTFAVRSKLDCARRCFGLNSGISLNYTTLGSNIVSCVCLSSCVPASNYTTRFQATVFSKRSASWWLNKPCTRNVDCPAVNAECYSPSSTCLCTPGYYYSHSCKTCVPRCDPYSLSHTFVKYRDACLVLYDDVMLSGKNSQECGLSCAADSRCLTFDHSVAYSSCSLSYATALTSHAFAPACGGYLFDHYQRMCS